MKNLLPFIMLFIFSCSSKDKKKSQNMPGAYKLLSQNLKSDITDTTSTSLKHLKIFTDDYMMYANTNPTTSATSFGIGPYSVNRDTVTENVILRVSDSTIYDSPGSYNLLIEKTAKGYKQVIPEISSGDQKVKLTEAYESVGTKTKSPVDGAWKLATVYKVKGTDTSMSMISHYKTYYAGYFVWGNAIPDASNTIHTGIGFGKFEMSGNNKLKESLITASDAALEGNDFELDIELNGNDELKQTRNNSDGTKNVEVYKRLKK